MKNERMYKTGDKVTFKKGWLHGVIGEIRYVYDAGWTGVSYDNKKNYYNIKTNVYTLFEEQELILLCKKEDICSECKNKLRCLTEGILKK